MVDLHDEIWRAVPTDRDLPLIDERHAFLRGLVSDGERVLDLGCGDGPSLGVIAEAGAHPVGVDVSRVALERAGERGAYELHRIEPGGGVPLDDASVDGVWCSEVLSQTADTGGLLSEARRVLRPGGWLGVTVPHHGRLKNLLIALFRFERHHHPEQTTLRHYTPASLEAQLSGHGFEQVHVRAAGGAPAVRELILASAVRGT